MSVEITTAFVEQYSANVAHLAQQKGSRLRDTVNFETVKGRNYFHEQIGATAARVRPSRHSDTPRMDTPHARRRLSTATYDWADLIDNEDKVRMLIDPTSSYALAAAMSMGRAMDDVIIAAADATAFTGQTGSTSTSYAAGMTVDVQVGGSSSDVGLNVAKLRQAKYLLDNGDVDPDEERCCVVNAKQLQNLLSETEVTSADYNTVRALVEGKIDTFMGFNFKMTNRIGVDANSDHKVLYYVPSGILLGVGMDLTTKISERDDKNYATQVFVSMDIGATRMEETKVGYIECDPT